jgi:hypothetical protein
MKDSTEFFAALKWNNHFLIMNFESTLTNRCTFPSEITTNSTNTNLIFQQGSPKHTLV